MKRRAMVRGIISPGPHTPRVRVVVHPCGTVTVAALCGAFGGCGREADSSGMNGTILCDDCKRGASPRSRA